MEEQRITWSAVVFVILLVVLVVFSCMTLKSCILIRHSKEPVILPFRGH